MKDETLCSKCGATIVASGKKSKPNNWWWWLLPFLLFFGRHPGLLKQINESIEGKKSIKEKIKVIESTRESQGRISTIELLNHLNNNPEELQEILKKTRKNRNANTTDQQ